MGIPKKPAPFIEPWRITARLSSKASAALEYLLVKAPTLSKTEVINMVLEQAMYRPVTIPSNTSLPGDRDLTQPHDKRLPKLPLSLRLPPHVAEELQRRSGLVCQSVSTFAAQIIEENLHRRTAREIRHGAVVEEVGALRMGNWANRLGGG